jgi:hypothetical protein
LQQTFKKKKINSKFSLDISITFQERTLFNLWKPKIQILKLSKPENKVLQRILQHARENTKSSLEYVENKNIEDDSFFKFVPTK